MIRLAPPRRTADSIGAVAPAELPRLASRPPGHRTRRAAAAGTPKTGSSTRSTGPSAASWSRVARGVDVVTGKERNSLGRTELPGPDESRLGAGHRDHPSRAAEQRELHRSLPDHTAGAEHHDLLPRGEPAGSGQRRVGRDRRQAEGRDQGERHARWQGDHVVDGHDHLRGHAAVTRRMPAEVTNHTAVPSAR